MVNLNSAFKKGAIECAAARQEVLYQYEIISIKGHHERPLLAGCTSCWQDVTSYDVICAEQCKVFAFVLAPGGFHRCV